MEFRVEYRTIVVLLFSGELYSLSLVNVVSDACLLITHATFTFNKTKWTIWAVVQRFLWDKIFIATKKIKIEKSKTRFIMPYI